MSELTKVVSGMNARNNTTQHEAPAAADVRAGHLIEEVADGVQPHATDGGVLDRVLFAIDARGRGMEVGDTYSTDPDGTVDNESVKYIVANAGVELTVLLGAGVAVTEGDRLVSAGDGTLRLYEADGTAPDDVVDDVVAIASEDLDNAAGTEAVAVDVEVTR